MTSSSVLPAGSLTGVTLAFDLDGTLVDTAPDLVGATNALLAEEGLAALPFAEVRLMVGRGARALIERGFAAAGSPLTPERTPLLVERFIEIYRGRIADESRAFEDLEATLGVLKDAGATLCVCTNKPTALSVLLLQALDLSDWFASVVGADAVSAAKPDPLHLTTAILEAGGEPSRAIMIGDSETDVKAARAVGVPAVLMSFGYTEIAHADLKADALLDHYRDLPAAVARLAEAL